MTRGWVLTVAHHTNEAPMTFGGRTFSRRAIPEPEGEQMTPVTLHRLLDESIAEVREAEAATTAARNALAAEEAES